MDPAVVIVMLLAVLLIAAGAGLVAASAALTQERQPDDPGYTPRHLANSRPVRDGLNHALNDSRRELRRSPAPWAVRPKRHSDKNPEDL